MGVTADGWLDWAVRLQPSPFDKNTNPGINSVRGIFMHSAEGYAGALLDPNSQWGYNGQHSWHLSNMMDGRVFQHYPFTARCHHATAANQEYVGVENEGDYPKELSLNEVQIQNAVRFTRDISAWKGWVPRRPIGSMDVAHTLWEHNEVVRIGGTSTSCPSGRIPWTEILRRLGALEEGEGENDMNEAEINELADLRAMTLMMRDLDFLKDGIYRPVAVLEQNGMLLIQLWSVDRVQPDNPPSFWVRKP